MGNDPYHTISKTLLKWGNTLKLWSARFKNVLSALILYSCTTSTPAGHSKWKARSVSVGFCSSALKVNTVTLPNTSCNFIDAGWPFRKPIKISFDTTIRLSFRRYFKPFKPIARGQRMQRILTQTTLTTDTPQIRQNLSSIHRVHLTDVFSLFNVNSI